MTSALEMPHEKTLRHIRSFVRRKGRVTASQQFALAHYWQDYVLDLQSPFDASLIFARHAPLFLEIGFGNGDFLVHIARQHPENNYLGIEVHQAGVGHLMRQLREQNITNVRIYCHDAIHILEKQLADASLAGLFLFFPDPWHEKKHHKRRIVNAHFLTLLEKKLMPNGFFHAATDWEDYAYWMLTHLQVSSLLENQSPTQTFCPRPDYRLPTKFERRGLRLGHGVWDLVFIKRYGAL